MKNNFLFTSPTAILGGAERTMLNLIIMLLKEGHDVTMLVMSRGNQTGWESIEDHPNFTLIIKKYKSEKASLPAVLSSLVLLSHKQSYDYTFSSHTHVNGMLSLMRKMNLLKTKYLVARESTFIFERYHGIPRTIFKMIYRFTYGEQDLLICQTEKMKLSLVNSLGFKPVDKIEVIANPVNTDYIEKQLADNNLNNKPFETLIVGCGRLIDLKKFDWLIEAFSHLTLEFPQAGVVIIGDGPERKKLKNLVCSLGLDEKIIFTGKIDNPIQWFNSADIGVISSEIEGFPNVLLEMMASGTKQIITTPCTDGLNKIPDITVTETCSTESIEKCLRMHLKILNDKSENHKKYIKDNRSVEKFWNQVVYNIKK